MWWLLCCAVVLVIPPTAPHTLCQVPSSSLSRKFSWSCLESPFSKKPSLTDSFITHSAQFWLVWCCRDLAEKGQVGSHVPGVLSCWSPHGLHQTFSGRVGPGFMLFSPSSLHPVSSDLLDCARKLINSLHSTHCDYQPNLGHISIYDASKETSRLC